MGKNLEKTKQNLKTKKNKTQQFVFYPRLHAMPDRDKDAIDIHCL